MPPGLARAAEATIYAHATSLADGSGHAQRAWYRQRVTLAASALLDAARAGIAAGGRVPTLAQLTVASEQALLGESRLGDVRAETAARERAAEQQLRDLTSSATRAALAASTPGGAPLQRCRRCRSPHVYWQLQQRRSGDEGMTVCCECEQCNARWIL